MNFLKSSGKNDLIRQKSESTHIDNLIKNTQDLTEKENNKTLPINQDSVLLNESENRQSNVSENENAIVKNHIKSVLDSSLDRIYKERMNQNSKEIHPGSVTDNLDSFLDKDNVIAAKNLVKSVLDSSLKRHNNESLNKNTKPEISVNNGHILEKRNVLYNNNEQITKEKNINNLSESLSNIDNSAESLASIISNDQTHVLEKNQNKMISGEKIINDDQELNVIEKYLAGRVL